MAGLDWIDLIVVSLRYLAEYQKKIRHNNLSGIDLHIAKYRHIKKGKKKVNSSTIWMVGCAITL